MKYYAIARINVTDPSCPLLSATPPEAGCSLAEYASAVRLTLAGSSPRQLQQKRTSLSLASEDYSSATEEFSNGVDNPHH